MAGHPIHVRRTPGRSLSCRRAAAGWKPWQGRDVGLQPLRLEGDCDAEEGPAFRADHDSAGVERSCRCSNIARHPRCSRRRDDHRHHRWFRDELALDHHRSRHHHCCCLVLYEKASERHRALSHVSVRRLPASSRGGSAARVEEPTYSSAPQRTARFKS